MASRETGELIYEEHLQTGDASMSDFYDEDDFLLFPGTFLGHNHRILKSLGEGGFGYIAKCVNMKTKTPVAVKVTKKQFFRQAQEELAILESLRHLDPDKANIIQWMDSFYHEERLCLEFELLDQSLFDFLEQRSYQPLTTKQLRPVVHQLTSALIHLGTVGLIHADVKPENIMVVDRRQQPLTVKLIDFGISFWSAAAPRTCEQSLWYRAPEVTLGLPLSPVIDMWSLGLVAAELAIGSPLYPAEDEYDLVKFIVETQGKPADYLLDCGSRSSRYFQKSSDSTWRFKSPEEFAEETGHRWEETRYFPLCSLEELEQVAVELVPRDAKDQKELRQLTELVMGMLQLDANERITPSQVLQHPFFCADQLTDSNVDSCSVTDIQMAEPQTSQESPERVAIEPVTLFEEAPSAEQAESSVCTEQRAADIQPGVGMSGGGKEGQVWSFFRTIARTFLCCFTADEA